MAQRNVLTRKRVTYVGLESTFGTVPASTFPNAMTAAVFSGDGPRLTLVEDMLELDDESIYRADAKHPVHGLQSNGSKVQLRRYLRATPSGGQLTGSGTAGSYVDRIFLKHALGVEHAAVGTTVASAASSTSFDLTSASNIKKGDFIAVTISGTPEWTRVDNVSSATVTVSPALSNTPSIGAVVRYLYNYALGESNTTSLSVYQGFVADSGTEPEYILTGCYGGVSMEFPIGQTPTLMFDGSVTAFTGPAASGSIDTATVVTEAMGAPVVVKAAKLYLAATGSFTRSTTVAYANFSVSISPAWTKIVDGGSAQAVAGVLDVGGRPRFVMAKVRTRFDAGSYDNGTSNGFGADDVFRMTLVVTSGTGTTMSHWIVELPKCQIIGKPELADVDGKLYMETTFGGVLDDGVTVASETGDDLARCISPIRVAFG